MKAALITEEQIKAIEDALNDARTFIRNGVALGFIRMPDLDCPDPAHNTPKHVQQALAIVKSLKVQEPVCYKLKKPYSDIFTDRQVVNYERVNWTPLYAGEQA